MATVATLRRLVVLIAVGLVLFLVGALTFSRWLDPDRVDDHAESRDSGAAADASPSQSPAADEARDDLAAELELNRSQPWLSRRQDWLGHARSCRETRSPLRTSTWQVPCDRGIKMVSWQMPAYGTELNWRETQ